MKKYVLIIIAAIAVLASCNDYETYGDMKEKERNAGSREFEQKDQSHHPTGLPQRSASARIL